MEQAIAKAAGISDPSPDATADKPSADPELGQRSRPTSSRASLPLSRRSSQHSSQGAYRLDTSDAPPVPDLPQEYQQQQEGGEEDGEDEFAWGPSHPCYPHLNPHVPLNSPLYHSTRIIRVKRDWMITGDLAPTFANLYPEVLDPLVSEETFRQIVKKINDELIAAFSPWGSRAWVDAVMGVATLWLWDDLGLTAVKAKLRALEKWLEEWNQTEGAKEGVKIIPLRRTGYLTLDFQIPDPHIGLDVETSRPGTQHTEITQPAATAAPQLHGDDGPYPAEQMPDLGKLRDAGQQHLPQPAPAITASG